MFFGGCQLQHAADSFVANWKTDVIRAALASHGLETEIRDIHTSPDQSRIRATFAARRTKKGAMAGFHAPASDTLIPVPDCLLVTPALRQALPVAEALAVTGASRKGTLAVQVTDSAGGLDISVSGGKAPDRDLIGELTALAQRHDLARLAWDEEIIVTRRPPEQDMGGTRVVPPPGAFLQATRDGADALKSSVSETVSGAKRVADLFSGCGTFALPLSHTAEVHAVEGDAAMLAALDRGWRHGQGLRKVTTEARDLFRNPLRADELIRFGAVVLDPPRAGAEAQVAQLAAADVNRIAYVSCNPVTFARDARVLTDAGFRLDWLQPVDQFRWSTHVELASQFTRS